MCKTRGQKRLRHQCLFFCRSPSLSSHESRRHRCRRPARSGTGYSVTPRTYFSALNVSVALFSFFFTLVLLVTHRKLRTAIRGREDEPVHRRTQDPGPELSQRSVSPFSFFIIKLRTSAFLTWGGAFNRAGTSRPSWSPWSPSSRSR